MQCSTIAVRGHSSKKTFRENVEQLAGKPTVKTQSFTVKTLNGEESMKSTVVSGLRVSISIADDKETWLNLPPVYTREDIPVNIEKVATRENIKSWDPLTVIAEKLPHAADIEIRLLIGADCAKAI